MKRSRRCFGQSRCCRKSRRGSTRVSVGFVRNSRPNHLPCRNAGGSQVAVPHRVVLFRGHRPSAGDTRSTGFRAPAALMSWHSTRLWAQGMKGEKSALFLFKPSPSTSLTASRNVIGGITDGSLATSRPVRIRCCLIAPLSLPC